MDGVLKDLLENSNLQKEKKIVNVYFLYLRSQNYLFTNVVTSLFIVALLLNGYRDFKIKSPAQ